jgi:hypothetical protein
MTKKTSVPCDLNDELSDPPPHATVRVVEPRLTPTKGRHDPDELHLPGPHRQTITPLIADTRLAVLNIQRKIDMKVPLFMALLLATSPRLHDLDTALVATSTKTTQDSKHCRFDLIFTPLIQTFCHFVYLTIPHFGTICLFLQRI